MTGQRVVKVLRPGVITLGLDQKGGTPVPMVSKMRGTLRPMALVAVAAGTVLTLVGSSAASHLPGGAGHGYAEKTVFRVLLTGLQEPEGGDPNGNADSVVRVGPGGSLCYRVYARDIAPITGAHIHEAPPGVAGPIVVPFTVPPVTQPNGTQVIRGCVNVGQELAQDILANPSNYYVNVHTAEFPAGAIRGQLGGDVVAAESSGSSDL